VTKENRLASGGVELTEELMDKLASEAESGYDLDKVRRGRRRGRPSLGSGPSALFQVRLDRGVRERLLGAARKFNLSPSQLAREALAAYLDLLEARDGSREESQEVVSRPVSLRHETWDALLMVARGWPRRDGAVRAEHVAGVIVDRNLDRSNPNTSAAETDERINASTRLDEPLDETYRKWRQPVLFAGRAA
jgi:hypothetical protein